MGRNIPHKYRKRCSKSKSSKSQRIRRKREELIKFEKALKNVERSKEVYLNNNEKSTCELPVISAVHGKEYFENPPFPVQLIEVNRIPFETDSIVIKAEPCEEENNMPDQIDVSVSKTIPETVPQTHLKDINIPYNQIKNSDCNLMHQNTSQISNNKENKLLFDVIKFLHEHANLDKFDIAGKLYAEKLRIVPFTNQQAMAENLCRQVLVEAEHFNLDEKIVLLKDQSRDHLIHCRTPCNVTNKNDLDQSFYLQLDQDSLFQIIENRLSERIKEDRFDKFGNFYATKMRSFSSFQYYCADKLINEIVLTAELGQLRANYRLTKTDAFSPQTFTPGKSYAKEYRTKISVSPASDLKCASNKAQSNKQLSSSIESPSLTSTSKKSYARRRQRKICDLLASKGSCAGNNTQSDKQFTNSSNPPPQTFVSKKSDTKKCQTKGSISEVTRVSSKAQFNKIITYSSTEPSLDSDDHPSQTFKPGKTYAKNLQIKASVLPVPDRSCASSETQSNKRLTTLTHSLAEPSLNLSQTSAKKVWTKASIFPVSNKLCSSSKTQSDKQFIIHSTTEKSLDPDDLPFQTSTAGKTYAKNSVLPVLDDTSVRSNTILTPSLISVQNNKRKLLESLPSPSVCNNFKVSDQKKTSQSASEQLINNSVQILKNSLFKPPVFPLKSIPAVISIQNNEQQKSMKNMIKVVFLKQGQ